MGLNARSIGLRIQQARVAKGMTQGELARALGIDRGSVGRWETGRSVPRQVGLPKVAKILGQSADWLLEGSGDLNVAADRVEVLRAERRTLREIREEVKKLRRAPVAVSEDDKILAEIIAAWKGAKPGARELAALLITGNWEYKLKLMNREIAIGDDVIKALVG